MSISEERIRNNKQIRLQEVHKQIMILIFTVLIILVLAITLGSTLSKAKDDSTKAPQYKYFTSIMVESGDSLCSIASEHMTFHYPSSTADIDEVKHINALTEDTIHAGQYLIIPYYSESFIGE
ncbi:MAG: hypothetical protein RR238_02365 [Lachnospiraceae bacterium]